MTICFLLLFWMCTVPLEGAQQLLHAIITAGVYLYKMIFVIEYYFNQLQNVYFPLIVVSSGHVGGLNSTGIL